MSRFVRWAYRASAATLGQLGLKDAVRAHILPKLVSAIAGQQADQGGPHGAAAAIAQRHLERLAASDKPILVGPWISEVGFELLYWIPFVRWAARGHAFDTDRLISVARGGSGTWYRPDCAGSVELLDLFTPEAFRQGNLARWAEAKGQKQGFTTAFEADCLRRAAGHLGLGDGDYEVLPPSLMYNIFWFVWNGKAPLDLLGAFGIYEPLLAPEPLSDRDPILPDGLPEQFIAVRFYSSESFPNSAANQRFLEQLLDRLTRNSDVLLLHPNLALDDHGDFGVAAHPRVHRLAGRLDPAVNLAQQSRIIARSQLFVGTYGGLAYLAPLLGVPSLSFYSDPGRLKPVHGELAGRVFETLGTTFIKTATGDYDLLSRWGA